MIMRRLAAKLSVHWLGLGLGLASLLLVGGGCGKGGGAPKASAELLSTDKKDYLGNWQAPGVSLSIQADKSVHYEKAAGHTTKEFTGKLGGFKGNDIVIDALIGITLVVQKPPVEQGGVWKMTVDGDELTKKDEARERSEAIKKQLEAHTLKQFGPIKNVTAVTCPLPAEGQKAFSCEAVLGNGRKAKIDVEQKGEPGHYGFTLNVSDIAPGPFAKDMSATISKATKKKIEIDCGTETLYIPAGESFDCKASGKKKKQSGTVTFMFKGEHDVGWNLKL